ncbi:anaphase-promoting complex subunit cdc27 [Rhodotorula mucilaginosa]|uniref:Anaphase-promoting complex subunit cdc27 n=1 Tax=Rhodotorula mucilaginosa TaxID=5537 RepID=A0A9P6VXI8_RHOMI|nr:anaphase-promoting complex subunit cdc27 [Rhodotorula mucilaginosa]
MAALADRPPPSRLVSPYPPAPATSVAQIGDLLRRLAVASLKYSPLTARFYAERALSLQPLSEPATCLLAQCHLALGSPHEALWLLRQPVAFTPVTSGGTSKQPRATTSSGRLILPANECSLRCARLYAEACRALRRDQEGRQVLAQVNRPGVALAAVLPLEGPPSNAQGVLATVADEPAEVELELARLAQRAGETDRAIVGYRKVLSRCPTCWEALEALCSLGEPPDVETLLPTSTTTIRPRSFPRESVPVASVGADHLSSASQTGPQPLTPSQNVVVNAPADYVHATRLRGDSHGPGLVTPIEVPLKPSGGVGWEVKGKGRDAAGAPPPLRRVNPGNYVGSRSTNEQDDSFDTTFYPATGTLSFAPIANPASGLAQNDTAMSSMPAARLRPTATGVKRTRAGTLAPASAHLSNTLGSTGDDDTQRIGQPPRRTARSDGKARRSDSAAAGTTRRSSRISNAVPSQNEGGVPMIASRSQTSLSSSRPTGHSREKKRSKAAGAGPSVRSDNSDLLPSNSSSPHPRSPDVATATSNLREVVAVEDGASCQEAEHYVLAVLRGFARALVALSMRRLPAVAEAIASLPLEQSRSSRAASILAHAHFDAMQYAEAANAFAQVRRGTPHGLEGMAVYSTTLWHLRQATALSLLAQELLAVAPDHAAAWIACGNVYSHVEDHANALRCFRRAAQVDEDCVYAYTLSGHESVLLEEWERASGFFREAIRRDPRHYNAWFGLGNVYLKTGKTTLAEYHFRKALQLNPSNATIACCVGAVLEKLGKRAEALDMYDEAKAVAPESSLVRFKRVRLLVRMQRHEAAEADLLALQHQAPTEPNVLYLLGQLYRNLGRRSEMLRLFAQAQDLEPRFASLIRQQIEQEGGAGGMDIDER